MVMAVSGSPSQRPPAVSELAEGVLDQIPGVVQAGLGDVAMVLAFTGLRWEEAVAVPIEHVDLDGQWITVDRTASESGGKRGIREDLKIPAAERVAAIPDIAMPPVRRLVERGAKGREPSGGKLRPLARRRPRCPGRRASSRLRANVSSRAGGPSARLHLWEK